MSRLQLSLAARDNSVSSVHSEHTREMELLQKRLRELELDLAACQVESMASVFGLATCHRQCVMGLSHLAMVLDPLQSYARDFDSLQQSHDILRDQCERYATELSNLNAVLEDFSHKKQVRCAHP